MKRDWFKYSFHLLHFSITISDCLCF